MGKWALIETARPLLHSPVRSIKYIRDSRPVLNLQHAGETALSILSDLMLPQTDTFAVAAKNWNDDR